MKKNFMEIERLKESASVAKDRLINIASDLESIGAIREAKTLYTIVGNLEAWQNK